ncbi:hypothetical protein ABIC16_000967 [Sphingomonas sp. PvP055]|uniref:hypothetical protein n=1 Tax=Sphingomonas sp. PvP055 TaxID=3156391 RepID=UPI00339A760B
MTHRDMLWRGIGVALLAAGSVVASLERIGESSLPGLVGFGFALFGFVLIVQGKRVPAAFRVERSRHKRLPQTLHARRGRRTAQRHD